MIRVVTNDGYVMPQFFFLHGLTLNMEPYIKFPKEVMLTWIEKAAARRPYIWQQNSAPCHISKKTYG